MSKLEFTETVEPTATIDKDARSKECHKCGIDQGLTNYDSPSWTSKHYCHACETLNIIYHSDRMGGATTDRVFLYDLSDILDKVKQV